MGQLTLDNIDIWLAVNEILLGVCCLEDHDTAEFLGVPALVQFDQVDHVIWGNVHLCVVGELRQGSSWKTDVELDLFVHGRRSDEPNPSVERDVTWLITLCAICSIEICASRALRSVIELDEEEIEPRGLNGMSQVSVRDDALRGARDVVLLLSICGEVDPQRINHGSISTILRGRVVFSDGTFDVEIKTIDDCIPKWTRAVIGSIFRSKCLPHELGEADGRCIIFDRLIGRNSSSQR